MRGWTVPLLAAFLVPASLGSQVGADGRAFAVLVDDARYVPAEVQGAGQLLDVLQDDVLGGSDLLWVVSTGRSSVDTDFHYAANRSHLSAAIRRIVEGPPSMAVEPRFPSVRADRPGLDAQVRTSFAILHDVLRRIERLQDRQKHLVFVASSATATVVLHATLAGSPAEPATVLGEASGAAAAAVRAGVVMHVVDPVDPASADLLRRLR